MLHERGALQLWLSAGDVPDYALYTATWALIAPKLPELFPGECMSPHSCLEIGNFPGKNATAKTDLRAC